MTNDPIIQGGQGRTAVQQAVYCVLAVLGGIGAALAAEFVFAYVGMFLFLLRSPLGG